MSDWETVTLGDVAEIVSGGTPKTGVAEYWGGPHAWATPADLTNLSSVEIDSTERTLTDAGISSSSARLLPAGSVLFSSRAPIGHIAITTKPMATNQGFKSFIPTPRINTRFLYWWLDANRSRLKALGTGATFKEVSKKVVSGVPISLPSGQEQLRIASILDEADSLRAKRRAQLAHLDELPQALFHETFYGRSDRVASLGGVALSIENGVSPVAETRSATDDEWGVLKLSAVSYGNFRAWENKAFLGDPTVLKRHEVRQGDVLMTRKNTPDLVGAVTLVRDAPARRAIPDLIFRINFDKELLDGAYAQALLMSPTVRRRVRNLAGGSAASMSNISKARLSTLQIPVPPLAIQQGFSEQVEAIHAERDRVAKALEADEELFAALQYRAFRGEL